MEAFRQSGRKKRRKRRQNTVITVNLVDVAIAADHFPYDVNERGYHRCVCTQSRVGAQERHAWAHTKGASQGADSTERKKLVLSPVIRVQRN